MGKITKKAKLKKNMKTSLESIRKWNTDSKENKIDKKLIIIQFNIKEKQINKKKTTEKSRKNRKQDWFCIAKLKIK